MPQRMGCNQLIREGAVLVQTPEDVVELLSGFDGSPRSTFREPVIGSDPIKYRTLMPLAVAEKLAFGVPALALFAQGYPVAPPVAVFAGIDLLLGLGFFAAWLKTPRA
jgi:predicted Rossmann fold nucleotide-binding protein DprA/Smf involved in DNA uptake